MALFFLLAGAASSTRDFRSESSWFEDSTGLGWSRLPFVDVLVVALELVFALKAVVATVLAPEYRAWKSLLVGVGAMLGLVVAFEVTKILEDDLTILHKTHVFSWLAVVALLMGVDAVNIYCVWTCETAGKITLESFTQDPSMIKIFAYLEAADTCTILLRA